MSKSSKARSKKGTDAEQAISWITSRVRHLAEESRIGIFAIQCEMQENENVFVMQIEGTAGKRAAKLFDCSELKQCQLSSEKQIAIDAQLSRFLKFFKTR